MNAVEAVEEVPFEQVQCGGEPTDQVDGADSFRPDKYRCADDRRVRKPLSGKFHGLPHGDAAEYRIVHDRDRPRVFQLRNRAASSSYPEVQDSPFGTHGIERQMQLGRDRSGRQQAASSHADNRFDAFRQVARQPIRPRASSRLACRQSTTSCGGFVRRKISNATSAARCLPASKSTSPNF